MDIFWQKVLVVLVSVLVIVSGNGEPLKRRKRMTVQSCAAVPGKCHLSPFLPTYINSFIEKHNLGKGHSGPT